MQQQGGGSQYGASPTEMAAAAGSATDPGKSMLAGSIGHTPHHQQQQFKLGDPLLAAAAAAAAAAEVEGEGEAEAASPISSRPPTIAHSSTGSFEEIVVVPAGRGGLMPDDDTLAGGVEEADRAGGGGNRWPRQETLALIKIRSDMDAAFRDATLKGPLWEDVSRKLAELGYKRSAKKCKEKFENVHKYYKRTKEGRAGRQDGKSYRFFSQLEALGATSSSSSGYYMSAAAAASSLSHQQQLVAAPLSAASIGIGITNPTPVVSSIGIAPLTAAASAALPEAPIPLTSGTTNLVFPPYPSTAGTTAPSPATGGGLSFSSDSFSSSSDSEEEEELDEEREAAAEPMEVDVEGEQTSSRHHRLKRKRGSSKLGTSSVTSSSSQWMMEFFEGLTKQVMQKQEAMQQRFLETIEKREQEWMIREEAWKRQEMARLAREHDLMARERAMSASRDAAIIAFLQKITGQTIQLPPPVSIPAAPPPPPPTVPNSIPPSPPPPQQSSSSPSQRQHHKTQQPNQQHQHQQQQQPQHYQQQQQQNQQQHQQQQRQQLHHHPYHPLSIEVVRTQQNISSQVVMAAVPEQQVPPQEIILSGGASLEASPSSSRWPKTEVLALIRLRSGLESRYQEAGPKGPLWEEISAGMLRMGYKRNAKRCKEKWENINKYFKKVKESNKARPADAKTCPYFHELDALYRKKILGSGFGSSDNMPEQQHLHQQETSLTSTMDPLIPPPRHLQQERTSDVPTTAPSPQLTTQAENKKGLSTSDDLQTSDGGLTKVLFGEGSCSSGGGRDHTGVNKPEDIMKEQQQQQKQQIHGLLMIDCDKAEEPDSDNLDQDEDEEEEDEEEEEEDYDEEEMKMAYKIEFQSQNAGSSSGGGNGAPPFLAIVR